MKSVIGFIATSIPLVLMVQAPVFGEVTVERSERGAVVKIDGELFTEYLIQAGQSPAMWPVIGPAGAEMTRRYPVGPQRTGETTDHPHHQSMWFTHDKVNGADFWAANVQSAAGDADSDDSKGARIVHREFAALESDGATARIVARNDWMNGEVRICEDERTIVFGTREGGDRWIDFTIVLKAAEGDVSFGDTKEGTFAVRVADSMRFEAQPGGRVVNSEGQVDDEAWGMPARWVDYAGPIAVAGVSDPRHNETAGILIMSHPTSFRPVPRWHVRGYGLFAANPFGEHDFPSTKAAKQGATTIPCGDELVLRYRVVLHRGATDVAAMEAAFDEFAAE